MKLSLVFLALAGADTASPVLEARRNPTRPGKATSQQVKGLLVEGMRGWGLLGAINAPTGNPGGPSRTMPLGLGWPELNRPPPKRKMAAPGTPGHPLGPQKKRIYPRPTTGNSEVCKMRPAGCVDVSGRRSSAKYTNFRNLGRAGAVMVFGSLSPFAHDILDTLKKWDKPIGQAVTSFDDTIASLQEAIGGKQVPEIHGNQFKLRIICFFKSENPPYPNDVDRACARMRAADNEPAAKKSTDDAIKGLNQVSEACEKAEQGPPTAGNLRAELLGRCNDYADKMMDIDSANAQMFLLGEWVKARVADGKSINEYDQQWAEDFVRRGAFGPGIEDDVDVTLIATNFLRAMVQESGEVYGDEATNETLDINNEEAAQEKVTPWMELLELGTGFVPEDMAAIAEAKELLINTPYSSVFEDEASLKGALSCWPPESLLLFEPPEWETISAAIVYLEDKIEKTDSQLGCAACQKKDGWVLRCGSTTPDIASSAGA